MGLSLLAGRSGRMGLGRLLIQANKNGSAESKPYLVTVNQSGTTVYLGGRLLLQTRDGTVTAFQADNNREAKLIQNVLALLSMDDNYSMIHGATPYLTEYKDGKVIAVMRPIDLLRRIANGPEANNK
jgi:hypothetical protein